MHLILLCISSIWPTLLTTEKKQKKAQFLHCFHSLVHPTHACTAKYSSIYIQRRPHYELRLLWKKRRHFAAAVQMPRPLSTISKLPGERTRICNTEWKRRHASRLMLESERKISTVASIWSEHWSWLRSYDAFNWDQCHSQCQKTLRTGTLYLVMPVTTVYRGSLQNF